MKQYTLFLHILEVCLLEDRFGGATADEMLQRGAFNHSVSHIRKVANDMVSEGYLKKRKTSGRNFYTITERATDYCERIANLAEEAKS